MQPFATSAAWRAWLEEHHATETELLVVFTKVGKGESITWPESVDEALCFGWIDGVRRRIDDDRYSIRFTRRKPGSTWSAINVAKVAQLETEGRMTDAGRAAFAGRREDRTAVYSHEQGELTVDDDWIRAHDEAWAFWERQPPSYKRSVQHWLNSAKKPETRDRRKAELLHDCRQQRRVRHLRRPD